jgi:mono/diheme cytochrome c family protein
VGTSGAGNHIPVGSADCVSCHASSNVETAGGTGFKVSTTPSLSAAGHTAVVSTVTCATCHGPGKVWMLGGGPLIKVPPGTAGTPGAANHIGIPSADGCNTCHANTNYVSFASTAMNHANITSGCASCHAMGDKWYGVTNLVTALSTHIPMSTADCSSCHAQNFATGAFKITTSPVLSVAGHAAVSALTCQGCHNNNATDLAFQGVGTKIYVRPGLLAVGLSPIDAAHNVGNLLSQDCNACHTTAPPFTSTSSEPSNHIPTGAGSSCAANCHKGGFTPATTVMDHADASVTGKACVTCHGKGAGPFYGTSQTQAGGQPMQPPGTVGVSGAGNHIPMGTGSATCNTGCHTAAAPATAVSGGFSFAMKGNATAHGVVVSGANCDTCHELGLAWYLDATGGKMRLRPNGHHTGQDCGNSGCHKGQYNGFNAAAAAAAKRPTSGLTMKIAGGTAGTGAVAPTSGLTTRVPIGAAPVPATGPYSHMGVVPGSCATCHAPGGGAIAKPGGHLPTALSCDACHRTTAWSPMTFDHSGVVPGSCANCHTGSWATRKPPAHFVTARACDTCHHRTTSWTPVSYDHLSPRYRPQPGIVRCIDCHTTNTEMVIPGLSRPAGRKAVPGGPSRNQ